MHHSYQAYSQLWPTVHLLQCIAAFVANLYGVEVPPHHAIRLNVTSGVIHDVNVQRGRLHARGKSHVFSLNFKEHSIISLQVELCKRYQWARWPPRKAQFCTRHRSLHGNHQSMKNSNLFAWSTVYGTGVQLCTHIRYHGWSCNIKDCRRQYNVIHVCCRLVVHFILRVRNLCAFAFIGAEFNMRVTV